ncbi:hypothetical protein LLG95_01530 [bacterium]|nr:hypothetical protein [bacterium]
MPIASIVWRISNKPLYPIPGFNKGKKLSASIHVLGLPADALATAGIVIDAFIIHHALLIIASKLVST